MPTYDYQCRSCGSVTEVIHSMLEEGPTACERCGGQLRRVLYPAGIIFKGSGFYRTDSRNGDKTTTSAPDTAAKTPEGGAKADSGSTPAPAGDAPKASEGSSSA